MSPSSPCASGWDAIVRRLRAAGCVFAEDEARLLISTARTPAELETLINRRIAGEPLEYILGWAEFCGLRIAVDAGVFVPRRRTALFARLQGRGQVWMTATEAALFEGIAIASRFHVEHGAIHPD